LADAGRVPLFQAIKHRPWGRGAAELHGERLHRTNAWAMVQRRAKVGLVDVLGEVALERVVAGHPVELAALFMQPQPQPPLLMEDVGHVEAAGGL